jgi:hypothetical protein
VLAVPDDADAHVAGLLLGRVEGRGRGVGQPLFLGHGELHALAGAEAHHVGDGLAVGLHVGFGLPHVHEAVEDHVERGVDAAGEALLVGGHGLGDHAVDAGAVNPGVGDGVLFVADRVQLVPAELLDAGLVEPAQDGQEGGLVGGQVDVRDTEHERLIALVAAAVEQRGTLGVRAGDDETGHAHDVELIARGAQTLDLFVLGDEHLAALVAALLHTGLLILDVIAGHADLDEPPHEIAHRGVAAMAGVRVGDDERAEVDLGGGLALVVRHAGAGVELILVGRQQRADDGRGLVGDLAERVAGEIGTGVLLHRALGAGGPAAEVDGLDAHALHGDGLPGRVRPERRDALALGEHGAQPLVEGRGSVARDGVIRADGAALLDDLAGRIQALDAGEPRALEPGPHLFDFLFERTHRVGLLRSRSRGCRSGACHRRRKRSDTERCADGRSAGLHCRG